MDKRTRSPNYPALSLPEAIDKVGAIYRTLHNHAAPREVIAKAMGYAGLNGASATAISALNKYGLLDKTGDDIKVGDRALCILHPHSPEERAAAIRDAAQEPVLFAELRERFPGHLPNEELLRNYLLRKKFAPAALALVVSAYRETSDMVERESGGHNAVIDHTEAAHMNAHPTPNLSAPLNPIPVPANVSLLFAPDERPIGRYDYEGGAYVRIVAGGDIETDEALDMVETLIQLKRAELKRKNKNANAESRALTVIHENEIEQAL